MEKADYFKDDQTDDHTEFIISIVYAKCDARETIELWDTLYSLANDMVLPWLVGRDFNVIWDEEEKFGGLPVNINEIDDFRHCITTCNLFDLGFKGSISTWWNGRSEENCIFKRRDRCLGNMELQQLWPGLEINHLSKIGSDHSLMHLTYNPSTGQIKKAFRFLNFWIKHESFLNVVKEHWQADFHASPFILFNHKMKKLKKALSTWSKASLGDIFQRIASLEEVVKVHETQFKVNQTVQNRERIQMVQADLIRVWPLEEEFWKQKAGMAWFKDGDRNTKLFHAHVNDKIRKLQLKRIQDMNVNLLEDLSAIADEAVLFFQQQFHESTIPTDFRILDHVPVMLNEVQNFEITMQPTIEEVKKAVFGLNGDSAGGPDGFNVLVNGQPHGFFKSTRGVKQGDPLSTTLFILAAEAMSRGLNVLHHNLYFCGFRMPKWSLKINHLAYADDAIIFSSSDDTTLRLIMEVLNACKAASRQLINKAKSAVYVHYFTSDEVVRKIEGITGIQRKYFPFIYLGCYIFYKRRKMEYYEDLISEVLDKHQAWKGKLLYIGGRAVLSSSVLQTMPIHLLSVVNPPAYV
ncbi:uncharacterized protein LOC107792240 [Nicotiana tabacum]|uniref:Uncharacterized protein LOC107792240 n=1 Tax=Nicotiana tabacum TaxID=4097 RepID=A0AC58RP57_TOBAC